VKEAPLKASGFQGPQTPPPPPGPSSCPHQSPMHLAPIPPPARQGCAPQQGLDPLHKAAGEEATGHLIAGMDESGAVPRAPAGLPAVQQPPALAPLLKQHQGCGSRKGHQQHPPTDAPLLQIQEHLNSREITGEGIGHGHGAEGPAPKAALRQGWPTAPPPRSAGHRSPQEAGLRSPGARAAAWGGPEGGTWDGIPQVGAGGRAEKELGKTAKNLIPTVRPQRR
jgi:hypothetical protein